MAMDDAASEAAPAAAAAADGAATATDTAVDEERDAAVASGGKHPAGWTCASGVASEPCGDRIRRTRVAPHALGGRTRRACRGRWRGAARRVSCATPRRRAPRARFEFGVDGVGARDGPGKIRAVDADGTRRPKSASAPRPSVTASMPALEGAVLTMLETPRDFKLPRGLWNEHRQRLRAEELRCRGPRSKGAEINVTPASRVSGVTIGAAAAVADGKRVRDCRSVQQLDSSTGEVLQTFPSVKAANETLGKNARCSNISGACEGDRSMAYGFA